ncbi:sugar ABC transporter permease [Streptomyces sp. AJS327]|uniref:carbohydrate ABC transporter permease n=1 Tax=Streptomyces sp. AJS327 TaxID=2545265 RepID=UPI0015DFC611|nr:sugar ABC transporter permease [Streptomyces sp. AJS327]MBA0051511.1 sugar ABC transporter permease [Streptomyces sp. AJS327]
MSAADTARTPAARPEPSPSPRPTRPGGGGTGGARKPGARDARGRRARRGAATLPYLLIAPAIVAIGAIFLWPLVRTVVMSFQDMGRRELWTGDSPPWVGFEQFTDILGDSQFWDVTLRTVLFMGVCVTVTMGAGLLVALLMQRVSTWVRLLLTGALVAAWSMPLLVATSVFRWFADSDYGVANSLLSKLPGVDMQGHNWFINPWQGFAVIAAVVIWGAVPFVVITLYAALTQVPRELEEAAQLDGAGPLTVFRNVVFPVIKPVFQMVATLSVIWDFNVFGQVFLMRGNKPEPEYELLGIYSFQKAFESSSFSQGAAIALITVLLLSGVAVYYLRQLLKTGEVE